MAIISAIVGVFIGIILTSLTVSAKTSDLISERDYYFKALKNEKLKVEQRDVLIRDIIKEPVTTTNQKTNS